MKAEIICEFQSPTTTELVLLEGNLSAPTDHCMACIMLKYLRFIVLLVPE